MALIGLQPSSRLASCPQNLLWLQPRISRLVYKQPGKISMTQRQSGCNAGLGTRIGDKTALAEQYNLSGPVAGNFLYTVYSPATDSLLCRFTRCTG